ncbi:unnamed protein product [Amoebophrya sp. A120]|nr:unnamed protein product [Amoebophrya sp. A120]|eukprot:GSA120T00016766001.1
MVVPLPPIYITPVPSEYALKCRPWFTVFAFVMLVESIQKMFLDLEIFPGFMVAILAGVGFYCLRDKSVDMHCLMTWGMVCMINGVLTVVLLIDRVVRPMSEPLFVTSNDQLRDKGVWVHNTKSLIRIASPVAMLCVAGLTYRVYNEVMDTLDDMAADQQVRNIAIQEQREQEQTQRLNQRQSAGAPQNTNASNTGTTFTPFGGVGNQLGGELD